MKKCNDRPKKNEPVFYLEFLRAIAAIAVVIIHVLGPYREMDNGQLSFDWLTAMGFNSLTRWCVPIFIMISGVLFLSDRRPFQLKYFVQRRVAKVVTPFLIWSLFYSFLAGLTPEFSYAWAPVLDSIKNLPYESTWYHLGFYYYFIPLYFLIPFLAPFVQSLSEDKLKFLAGIWLLLTLSFFLKMDTFWHIGLLLYGGYLVWGYCLVRWDTRRYQSGIILAGLVGLALTFYGVVLRSLEAGEYSVGYFMSYKTINTVLVTTMVFCLAKHYADRLPQTFKKGVLFISRYSLGLYLVHPLLLWPVRAYDLYWGSAALMIPFWTVVNLIGTLCVVWLLARSRLTRWMVP